MGISESTAHILKSSSPRRMHLEKKPTAQVKVSICFLSFLLPCLAEWERGCSTVSRIVWTWFRGENILSPRMSRYTRERLHVWRSLAPSTQRYLITMSYLKAEPSPRSLLILYATETGTAQDAAERIARQCRRIYFHSRVSTMATYPPVR